MVVSTSVSLTREIETGSNSTDFSLIADTVSADKIGRVNPSLKYKADKIGRVNPPLKYNLQYNTVSLLKVDNISLHVEFIFSHYQHEMTTLPLISLSGYIPLNDNTARKLLDLYTWICATIKLK